MARGEAGGETGTRRDDVRLGTVQARRAVRRRGLAAALLVVSFVMVAEGSLSGCLTVERGEDFDIAEVTFDEDFYVCRIEPMLFASSCGSGAEGDPAGGCHYNVTSYRLTEYAPLASEDCVDGRSTGSLPPAARANYQATQSQMRRDPELAKLLNRPTGRAAHPRVVFAADSSQAELIREWATRFSSQ